MSSRKQLLRLIVLALAHFVVDFCGGLTFPLLEPTLVDHLGVGFAKTAFLVGAAAILLSAVQPISGWLLPKRGVPMILFVGPLLAALMPCIGITRSFPVVAVMFLTASVGIGILHPEGALAAYSLPKKHKSLSINLFLAGGYFGFATGGLVGGLWAESHEPDLAGFWILALPAVAVAVLVLISGLHRIQGHVVKEESVKEPGAIPFSLVIALALCMAISHCLLARLITVFFVRSFPEQGAQAWGGTVVCIIGIGGALAAFLWNYLGERFGRGKLTFILILFSAPFLYMLLNIDSLRMSVFWAVGLSVTMGSVFPLCVVLARQARGLGPRLRMGLVIGGVWGTGELIFILSGRYIGLFPSESVAPVLTVLNSLWFFLIVGVIVSAAIWRIESFRNRGAAA